MLNKNFAELELLIQEANEYDKLKKKIASSLLPSEATLMIFIFDEEKFPKFLDQYYEVQKDIRKVYNFLFDLCPDLKTFDKKSLLKYRTLKTDFSEIKSIDFFNVERLNCIYKLLKDELKKIKKTHIEDYKSINEKLKLINKKIKSLYSFDNFLNFSDSSLFNKRFEKYIKEIYTKGECFWDLIEDWKIDTTKYNDIINKHKYYNTFNLIKSDSIEYLKNELKISNNLLDKFASWNSLFNINPSYFNNDDEDNCLAIRNLNLTPDLESFFDLKVNLYNEIVGNFHLDQEDLMIRLSRGDLLAVPFYSNQNDGYIPFFFNNWFKKGINIYFLFFESIYMVGVQEAFNIVYKNICFDLFYKLNRGDITKIDLNLSKKSLFVKEFNFSYCNIFYKNIEKLISDIEKVKSSYPNYKTIFMPICKESYNYYFKFYITDTEKTSINDYILAQNILLDNFDKFIKNIKINDSYLQNILFNQNWDYVVNHPHDPNYDIKILSENLINNIIDNILENNQSVNKEILIKIFFESLFKTTDAGISSILIYPLYLDKDTFLGNLLFIMEYGIFSSDIDSLQIIQPEIELIEQFLTHVEKDIYIDLMSNINKELLLKDGSNLIENLNKSMDITKTVSIFPSVYFITQETHKETFTKISDIMQNLSGNTELIGDKEDFIELGLEFLFTNQGKIFDKEELEMLKAIYIYNLHTFEGKKLKKPIIFIFGFKTYNMFLFRKMYIDNFVFIIREYIYSQLRKAEIIELKNLHEMMFGMLEHKINNDIIAYGSKLNKVKELIKSNVSNIENPELIYKNLNFVISRNEERKKVLETIKPLFLSEYLFSGNTEKINFNSLIFDEIENTKEIKKSSDKEVMLIRWDNLKYKIFSEVKDFECFTEATTFLKFIIFESLTNAVKYKCCNNPETTIDFYIEIIHESKDSYLKISISNSLKDKDIVFFSDKNNLKSIFEKGKRLEDTKTTTGSGLGLYIINYIVENRFSGKSDIKIYANKFFVNFYLNLNLLRN